MKFDLEVKQVVIKCEFNNIDTLNYVKYDLIDYLYNNRYGSEIKLRVDKKQRKDIFSTIIYIYMENIKIGKIKFGSYFYIKDSKKYVKYYFLLEINEPKVDFIKKKEMYKNTSIDLDEDGNDVECVFNADDSYSYMYFAVDICKYFNTKGIEYSINSLNTNLSVPCQPQNVFILTLLKNGDYLISENNFKLIDNKFSQIFNTKSSSQYDKTIINYCLSYTYFHDSGLNCNDYIKCLKNEYLFLHLNEEEIDILFKDPVSLDKNIKYIDKDEFKELNLKKRIISYDFKSIENFFDEIKLKIEDINIHEYSINMNNP